MHRHGGERGSIETEGILGVLASFSQLRHHGAWIEGRWHCDFSVTGAIPRLLQEIQLQTRSKIDLRWLPFARAVGSGVLLRSDGGDLRHSDVRLIVGKHAILAAILAWQWIATGRLSFSCVSLDYPLPTRAADQFRDLCSILVANYPHLLRRPADPLTVTTYEHVEHEWTLTGTTAGTTMTIGEYPAPTGGLGYVVISNDIGRRAGASCAPRVRKVSIWGHSMLSRVVQLWPGTEWWQKTRKQYKALGLSAAHVVAIDAVITSSRDLQWRHDRLGGALVQISWKTVHTVPGSTSQQRRLLFKIKSNRLFGWDTSSGRTGCPHQGCKPVARCDTTHIMWECPAAQTVWALTTAAWRELGA